MSHEIGFSRDQAPPSNKKKLKISVFTRRPVYGNWVLTFKTEQLLNLINFNFDIFTKNCGTTENCL